MHCIHRRQKEREEEEEAGMKRNDGYNTNPLAISQAVCPLYFFLLLPIQHKKNTE